MERVSINSPNKGFPYSHHIAKRKCNVATCVTQRLADFMGRSSNTIGVTGLLEPTNVGSSTYGKRSVLAVRFPDF